MVEKTVSRINRRRVYRTIVAAMFFAVLFGCAGSNPDGPDGSDENPGENAEKGNVDNVGVKVTSDNLSQAEQFLKENAAKEGIIVTASGLQYEILSQGSGRSPELHDTVVTHYAGRFLDGTEFDSSIKRGKPASFPVSGVIKGWTQALQLMHEGDKWRLYIPPELAYGERGRGSIPPNSALIFDIELIEVK